MKLISGPGAILGLIPHWLLPDPPPALAAQVAISGVLPQGTGPDGTRKDDGSREDELEARSRLFCSRAGGVSTAQIFSRQTWLGFG